MTELIRSAYRPYEFVAVEEIPEEMRVVNQEKLVARGNTQ